MTVITFGGTTQAIAFDRAAKAAGLSGRLIPTPAEISADCGLAYRVSPFDRAAALSIDLPKGDIFDDIDC